MGYYTDYCLEIFGDEDKVKKFEEDLKEEGTLDDGYGKEVEPALLELLDCSCVNAKLYDLDSWIKRAAEKNPDVLVILHGDGEESDDLWEARWKGSSHEFHEAIIPPFTTKELMTEAELINNK